MIRHKATWFPLRQTICCLAPEVLNRFNETGISEISGFDLELLDLAMSTF